MGAWVYFLGIFMLPIWTQWKVRKMYIKNSLYTSSIHLTGAKSARKMLDKYGLVDVKIEEIPGILNDHYDPKKKTVFLSQDSFHGTHIAAIAVASHEVGHAIQHKENDIFLRIQHKILPLVNIGSSFSWVLMVFSLWLHVDVLMNGALFLLITALLFQLIHLPVEKNANINAKKVRNTLGSMPYIEEVMINKLLNTALITYVNKFIFFAFEFIPLLFIMLKKEEQK